jgi:hypothetical protein
MKTKSRIFHGIALFTRLTFVLIAIACAISMAWSESTHTASASNKISLSGHAYRTPSGTVVDIVTVPGFGKCLITPGGPICKLN